MSAHKLLGWKMILSSQYKSLRGIAALTLLATFAISVFEVDSAEAQNRNRRRPAPKKKPAPKVPETPKDGFEVKSKEVRETGLISAQRSAKKIDQMVERNYRATKTTPNKLTTDAQFLRRVYLDITGTIPTYNETRLFLISSSPTKRERLIDRLLNSDGYSSHFYNYWADILRVTDRLNNNTNGQPYREWIKQSLAENKPWDKMVHEMISAEGKIWDNPATGYMQRDSGMPLDNMNNTVRIFLGTRIGCAQCHNHPFDRWTQKEFYQMAAFTFGMNTRRSARDKQMFGGKDQNARLRREFKQSGMEMRLMGQFNRLIRENLSDVNDNLYRKISLPHDYQYDDAKPKQVIQPKVLFGPPAYVKKGEAPRKAFADWMTSRHNPRFARTIVNRLWKKCFGVAQIQPVDDIRDDSIAENPPLMTFLESEMKRLKFDMKEFLRIIYNTETYQRQAFNGDLGPADAYHFPGPLLRRMTAEQTWDSFLTLAVVKPDEFKAQKSSVRGDIINFDLSKVKAKDVLDKNDDIKQKTTGKAKYTREKKYRYKGLLLARASELPSPVPPDHFLRQFGQSDRELIDASSLSGSVPQVLTMFNGPITHMMLEPGSEMYQNVTKEKDETRKLNVVFMSILNRKPTSAEMEIARDEIRKNGNPGFGNVIWSLVNTREFLFIQ